MDHNVKGADIDIILPTTQLQVCTNHDIAGKETLWEAFHLVCQWCRNIQVWAELRKHATNLVQSHNFGFWAQRMCELVCPTIPQKCCAQPFYTIIEIDNEIWKFIRGGMVLPYSQVWSCSALAFVFGDLLSDFWFICPYFDCLRHCTFLAIFLEVWKAWCW